MSETTYRPYAQSDEDAVIAHIVGIQQGNQFSPCQGNAMVTRRRNALIGLADTTNPRILQGSHTS